MNKRKLWNGIVIGICAVFVCVTVVLYSVFTNSQIFHESAGHLAEIYEQVNTTFKEKVTDYRNLMRSWKKYINNATGNPERYEEFKTFVAGQKKTWGFTDFYFINTDEDGQPKVKDLRVKSSRLNSGRSLTFLSAVKTLA